MKRGGAVKGPGFVLQLGGGFLEHKDGSRRMDEVIYAGSTVHNSCMWDPCVWLFLYVKEVVPIYFVVILISLFYFPPLSHCICMHSFHGKLN